MLHIGPKHLVAAFGIAGSFATTGADAARAAALPRTANAVKAVTAASPASVDGPTVTTGWGPVQVRIVIAKHKVTDVKAPIFPNHKRRSVAINNRALPLLRAEVLKSQSAVIDNVSGATVTTGGYTKSLQQAIDLAKQQGSL